MDQVEPSNRINSAPVDPGLSNSGVIAAFRRRTTGSAEQARQAATLFPSGITHDSRFTNPYGVYIARAEGPHKWDVDGNRYVDFYGGHGALILGHRHPSVTQAVSEAMADGTHFGANHPREILWARAIQRLVPSAERVRFTSSGTEATLMAVRLARAFTGRQTIIRFQGHFHGWHDHMTSGYTNHYDGSPTPGVLPGVAEAHKLAGLAAQFGLPELADAAARLEGGLSRGGAEAIRSMEAFVLAIEGAKPVLASPQRRRLAAAPPAGGAFSSVEGSGGH